MEVERLRFLLRSYMRIRLHKVQTNVFYILKTRSQRSRLSLEELDFAKGYVSVLVRTWSNNNLT